MSDEMEFGDIQFSQPELARRPDDDPRYAVVAIGTPDERELPIFVAVDTLRTIEQYVGHNTSIELGGVLLGCQNIDDLGRPFVVVYEALEAQHYEATKGSFKFTMDTWQDLLQRAACYPAPLRIVGWYHSHPGWGIFLSEMDLFICQGFFNNPLDIALVVDPCQDRRGWFHWQSGENGHRKQQNAGFYLFDTRHRQMPLQRTADLINQAEQTMSRSNMGSSTLRSTSRAFSAATEGDAGASPAQVIISHSDSTWPLMGMMAMLGLQSLLIALIAWAYLKPAPSETSARERAYEQVLLALIDTLEPDSPPPVTRQRLQALLDRRQELQQLESANRLLTVAAEASQQQIQTVAKQLESTESALQQANALNRDLAARVQAWETAQASGASTPPSGEAGTPNVASSETANATSWWSGSLVSSLIGILGLAVGGLAGGWWISRRHQELTTDMED